VLRAFGASQADIAFQRQFHLSERMQLRFRGEFFNIFNHPNFGPPDNNITDSLFGYSSGFSAEFSIEEHGGAGVTETQFYLPNTFSTQEFAIQAAIQAARQKYRYGLRAGIGRSELSRIEPQTMRRISR
jgi:hypothetical protein